MLKFLNILNIFNVTCDSEVVEKDIFYYLFSHLLVVSSIVYCPYHHSSINCRY